MAAQEPAGIAAVRGDARSGPEDREPGGAVARHVPRDEAGGERAAGDVRLEGPAVGEAVEPVDLPAFAVVLALRPVDGLAGDRLVFGADRAPVPRELAYEGEAPRVVERSWSRFLHSFSSSASARRATASGRCQRSIGPVRPRHASLRHST